MELGTTGELRAELNGLVLAGTKRATAGLLSLDYVAEGEEMEHVGERLLLLDDSGSSVAEVTAIEVVPFAEVAWEFAQSEGEGFQSVEHWREVHRGFWAGLGGSVDVGSQVVCLTFRLVGQPY